MYNFKEDLKLGHVYELKALDRLLNIKQKEYLINQDSGKNSEYDFIYGGVKYEVKYDKKSKITGNIFIECKCNNKLSGINLTTSKYYIITDGDIYWKIKTSEIKEKLTKYKYIKFYTDSYVEGVIIPINDIKQFKSLILI